MPEIRIPVSERLNDLIKTFADKLGVKKTVYIKTLILNELKSKEEINQ